MSRERLRVGTFPRVAVWSKAVEFIAAAGRLEGAHGVNSS